MSIRGGFDRLTKEIDALTYNSRSVLNALIRSTVASGTSQGYSVTRAGVKLTLSRVDIYRLYTFYQAWAANNYAVEAGETTSSGRLLLTFDQIRLQQDETPVVDNGTQTFGATTDALVTNSQILFLNSTTLGESSSTVVEGQIIDSTNSTDYWLNLLKDFNDPKLLTNSSPIPINLRTPVFDENMGTTAYNNQPSYLFPYQYFGLQLLGYPGDDTNHFGGGKSWNWEIDEFLRFKTPAFSSGDVSSSSVYKTAAERNYRLGSGGAPIEKTWSTVWGFDTHARSLYSTAGGRSSMVPRGANNSTAIGLSNLASAIQTTAIGGTLNQASAQNSGIFAGKRNITAGATSFATGGDNITGGYTAEFTLPQSDASNECVVYTDNCESGLTTGSQFGANQIAISGNIILPSANRLGGLAVGDDVVIYAYTTFVSSTNESKNLYYSTNGDTFVAINTKIIGMGYIDDTTSLNFGKTVITLNDDLPNPARIDGGKITRRSAIFGENNTKLFLGSSSSVFGDGNIAAGVRQTVVGSYNRQVVVDTTNNYVAGVPQNFRLSRFIVGSGTGNEDRRNTLEVYDGRLVVYASNSSIEAVPVTDEQYASSTFKGFNVDDKRIKLMYNTSRVEVNEDGFIVQKYAGTDQSILIHVAGDGTGGQDQLRIENWAKSIRVQTGQNTSLVTDDGLGTFVGDLDIALVSANDVHISALDKVFIQSEDDLYLSSKADLDIRWVGDLVLSGNTIGALPTTDKQYSHTVTGTSINIDNFSKSGFYFVDANSYSGTMPTGIGDGIDDGFHLLTMAPGPDINNGNSSMQLAWAGPTNGSGSGIDNIGRPSMRASDAIGNGYYQWRNLAYLDDVGTWDVYNSDSGSGTNVVTSIKVVDAGGAPVTSTGWSPSIVIAYCVTASTAFFKIRLSNLSSSFPTGSSIQIQLNSNIGFGAFTKVLDNDRSFDTENAPDLTVLDGTGAQGRFFARFIRNERIIQIKAVKNNGNVSPNIDAVQIADSMTFSMFSGHKDT